MNGINFEAVQQTAQAMQQDESLHMRPWQAKMKWENGVKNELKIRDFDPITVDEPAVLGGTDTGANPVELLIGAALGCFTITTEVVASEMGITLEGVESTIDADLNAAVFLGLKEGDGGILNPTITLRMKADTTQEKLEEIAAIALEKSPVLLSLQKEVQVKVIAE